MPADARRSHRPGARSGSPRPSTGRLRETTRPGATAGRGAEPAPAGRAGRGGSRSMLRMTILGGIFVLLAILIMPTLRGYLQQRSQIHGLTDQVQRQRADVAALQAEKKKWQDPAYVQRQAQQRLLFAKPGQSVTVYVDSSGRARPSGPPVAPPGARNPWYGQAWDSIVEAGGRR